MGESGARRGPHGWAALGGTPAGGYGSLGLPIGSRLQSARHGSVQGLQPTMGAGLDGEGLQLVGVDGLQLDGGGPCLQGLVEGRVRGPFFGRQMGLLSLQLPKSKTKVL